MSSSITCENFSCTTCITCDTILPMTIRAYLDESGLSVEKLSKIVGIAQPSLYRWLAGKCFPSGENLLKLIRGTGGRVTADDVLGVRRRRKAA